MEKSKLQDIIERIELQQQQIAAYGEWDNAIRKKLNYKMRLDWNYYSNRMEGGTLTQAETRSVMVGNIEVNGKPLKDIMEMRGHDQVVRQLLRVGHNEKRISETRIKALHKAIMYEEDAEKQLSIGQWKTEANMIYSYKDEKINFTPPEQVAEELHQLIDSMNAYLDRFEKGKHSEHPIVAIARFHVGYLSIHPFYDGNGRTARILTNLLLIACGLPAIIIKDSLKTAYYQLLGDVQAYGGSPDLLTAFIGERVYESQALVLKALQGDSLEEPDDLDKRIALLERELEAVDPDKEIKKRLGKTYFMEAYHSWIGDLMTQAIPVIQKFNRLFAGTEHYTGVINKAPQVSFQNESVSSIIKQLEEKLEYRPRIDEHREGFIIGARYTNLVKGGLNTFDCSYSISIHFHPIKYMVLVDTFDPEGAAPQKKIVEDRLLHKPPSQKEIKTVVNALAESILQHIDYHTQQAGLRPGKSNED